MSDERKLVDVVLRVPAEMHEMRKGMEGMRSDISNLSTQQKKTNSELVKVNLQLA